MKLISLSTTTLLAAYFHSFSLGALCSSNLLVDDYAKFSSSLNSLNQYTSDDGTTSKLTADNTNKKITFTANTDSYVYETFGCQTSTANQYNAISFPIKGPPGATFALELQTFASCSATKYKSYYLAALPKMDGSTIAITVPLTSFTGANLNAIGAVVFESFTAGAWEIGMIQLVCGSSGTLPATARTQLFALSTSSTTSSNPSPKLISHPVPSSSVQRTTSTTTTTIVSLITLPPSSTCTSLLIDDFASQSRLTFLFYNAMLQPSSDDGTMKPITGRADTSSSVIVANNHVTLSPANSGSYFYSLFGCVKATNVYGGIAVTISAPAGTVITVEMQTSSDCSTANPTLIDMTSTALGWVFDGTEKFYTIPFNKFTGLDTNHLIGVLFSGFTKPITLGPLAFYCGNAGTPYPIPSTIPVTEPSATVPPTTGPSAFVIDTFAAADTNALGFYHGGDDATTYKQSGNKLTINTNSNSDVSWYSQFSNSCGDFTADENGYLHIAFTGSNAFTVALLQHNPTCNENMNPYPLTWDSVEASRYSNSAKTDLYIPMNHFHIDRTHVIGISLKGFYTSNPSIFSKIEIVKTVPSDFLVPSKIPTAPLIFACTRPNSFAFAIDDGDPRYAQQVLNTIKAAGIKVTFFTVGAALLDQTTNLTNVYAEALTLGHQVAYHSFTHPPMEGLPSLAAIDWELSNDIAAVQSQLSHTSLYFRPPFGTEGARVRQRLAAVIPNAKFVEWSVDVQDYLWALSSTPQNQVTNFQSDVEKGGNLVVMHYLYQTTVDYLPQFIEIAKKTGKTLMRVDQCLEDPDAPPL